MERLFSVVVFASAMLSGMLALSMAGASGAYPYLTPDGSGLAALALFASLPLADEALMASGSRVGPFAAGISLAPPLFFFMRQDQMAQSAGMPLVRSGADHVLITACVLSIVVHFARRWIRSYRRGR